MIYLIYLCYAKQPFKMVAWAFNWIIGQIAWTIIRFEIHHLWNPDWTYAFPQGTVNDNSNEVDQLPEPIEEQEVFLTGEEDDESTTVHFRYKISQLFSLI